MWEEGENGDELQRKGDEGEGREEKKKAWKGTEEERDIWWSSVELPTERNPDRFHRGLT